MENGPGLKMYIFSIKNWVYSSNRYVIVYQEVTSFGSAKRKFTSRSTNVDADSFTYRVNFEARSKWSRNAWVSGTRNSWDVPGKSPKMCQVIHLEGKPIWIPPWNPLLGCPVGFVRI